MQTKRRPSRAVRDDSQQGNAVADKEMIANGNADEAMAYEIKVRGYLAERWRDWLGGLEISHDGQGYSLLTGVVPDQAALHGILAQIRDLGLPLISITPQDTDDEEQARYPDDPPT